MIRIISETEYKAALIRTLASAQWWNDNATVARSGMRSIDSDTAGNDPATNEDRSLVETYKFQHDRHDGWYTAYWTGRQPDGDYHICTWVGDLLAIVIHQSAYESRGATRSKRVAFRALGIDGYVWAGTYYESSGSYVHMRRVKLQSLTKSEDHHRRNLMNESGGQGGRTDYAELVLRNLTTRKYGAPIAWTDARGTENVL